MSVQDEGETVGAHIVPPDPRAERTQATETVGTRVWGFGGPTSGAGSHDGQSALKLHRGISVIAFLLCVLVVVVFLLDGVIVPAIIFAVIGLGCVGIFLWCNLQLARARASGDHCTPTDPHAPSRVRY
ncbi:hypothetical protein GCM10009836_10920 [Pseudonocardia ailaonensis]|uniref:DUF3040 domain-containing protein n=1 Tax=Pseudonocardia ailaonensis TaxID=367279 RepID=A0ABN2MQU0_9PSEU